MTDVASAKPRRAVRPRRRLTWSSLFELLGSMRFAIYLLMIICIASVVGTVLPQNMGQTVYIDQFGLFWYEVLSKFDVWSIYNSTWFLVIMAFLVVSTTICLIRNTPKMLRDMRTFREHVRGSSLRAFRHRFELETSQDIASCETNIEKWLKSQGYRFKERREENGVLIAAKKGSGNRLGYIFAHAAIVIICIGGLLDSELPVRLQVWLYGKTPILENMSVSDVPASGRLSVDNPSFRSNLLIPEGASRSNAIVNVDEGALVQPLPFEIELKKFIVDYYSTGMPSRFASEVIVRDLETNETFEQLIEVNEPLRYRGVTVYQSSFDDGGSTVDLAIYPLSGVGNKPLDTRRRIGEQLELTTTDNQKLRLEVTALRPINVEDMTSGVPQPKALMEHVAEVTGSAGLSRNKNLRNIGPSVEYTITDNSGQSILFHNYMVPVTLEDLTVFLLGVDTDGSGQFSFLRLPVDDDFSMKEFLELRSALANPALRLFAAQRFAQAHANAGPDQKALETSAKRTLDTFANGGLQQLSQFLEQSVSPEELPVAVDAVIRLLGSSMSSLREIVREQMRLEPIDMTTPESVQWTQLAVGALSDLTMYPSPVLVSMKSFEHVQASVFQVSRAPGMITVYIGCLLLILGVFAMFYVRDRRIWVWLSQDEGQSDTKILAAMTSQKRTLDFNREFERFKQAMSRLNQKEI